jgi:hypothetical protein
VVSHTRALARPVHRGEGRCAVFGESGRDTIDYVGGAGYEPKYLCRKKFRQITPVLGARTPSSARMHMRRWLRQFLWGPPEPALGQCHARESIFARRR